MQFMMERNKARLAEAAAKPPEPTKTDPDAPASGDEALLN
jgi:hypothetical protein